MEITGYTIDYNSFVFKAQIYGQKLSISVWKVACLCILTINNMKDKL